MVVALSAGPDSTALLAAMAALRDAGEIRHVWAVHIDHGLRPGSAEDGTFAAKVCAELAVPFSSVGVLVAPGNVQAEARRVRYAALREQASSLGASRIATGHTRTDQAETVLLRLLRGAGARGLSGIPPRRGMLVRPLIDRSRAEVLAYLADAGLGYRDDPSNESPRYARNRVRHRLSPVIKELAPAAEQAISRSADLLRSDDRALSARARACLEREGVTRARLLKEARAVRRRVVRLLWRRVAGGRGELSLERVDAVLSKLSCRTPWRLSLPGRVEACGRYGRLEIAAPRPAPAARDPLSLPGPGRYPLPGRAQTLSLEVNAPQLVRWPLLLRTRLPGDRFRPEGGSGEKKLKAWLIDRKIPREERDSLLLVAEGSNVLALPELGARAQGAGPNGAGLVVRVEPDG